jgi:hypothetical protein
MSLNLCGWVAAVKLHATACVCYSAPFNVMRVHVNSRMYGAVCCLKDEASVQLLPDTLRMYHVQRGTPRQIKFKTPIAVSTLNANCLYYFILETLL